MSSSRYSAPSSRSSGSLPAWCSSSSRGICSTVLADPYRLPTTRMSFCTSSLIGSGTVCPAAAQPDRDQRPGRPQAAHAGQQGLWLADGLERPLHAGRQHLADGRLEIALGRVDGMARAEGPGQVEPSLR